MTTRSAESFLEQQIEERLNVLLHNTRVEILKSGAEVGTTFHVEISQNNVKLIGFDATAPATEGGSWVYQRHVYADLAGMVRSRTNASLELQVTGPLVRKEGLTIDFTAMESKQPERERAIAD